MRKELPHDICFSFLHKERPGELGKTPHFVQVHLLGHLFGVVDEARAEECCDSEQTHGHTAYFTTHCTTKGGILFEDGIAYLTQWR